MLPKISADDLVALYGDVPAQPDYNPPGGYDDGWSPMLAPTQQRIFDSPARFILAEGERFSGKTYGIGHKMVKHCWEHFNAHVLVVVGVRRQATAGGIWHKLLTEVLPDWKRNLDGFDNSEQKQNTEKDLFVWVANKHGGWSMIQLISIPYGASLAARIRGIEASMIFVDELVGIGGPEYFEALIQQVGRRPGIPPEAQQYIAATNPDGPSHWVYKRFHEMPRRADGTWDDNYAWFHVPIAENPSPNAKAYYQNVLEAVRNDPVEYARMVEGKWVDRPSGEAIFARYFIPDIHVKGNLLEGKILLPRAGMMCTNGYDLGDTNHAIVFLQERHTKEKTVWIAYDEIVYTDDNVPFDVLVPELLQRMNYWGTAADSTFAWQHISDKSAFDRFRAATGSYDHRQIETISRHELSTRKGQYPRVVRPINLTECPKPPGSVAARIKVLMNALQREELFISARCEKLIEAIKFIESKKNEPFEINTHSRFKHPFDALTYPLYLNALGGAAVHATSTEMQPQLVQGRA